MKDVTNSAISLVIKACWASGFKLLEPGTSFLILGSVEIHGAAEHEIVAAINIPKKTLFNISLTFSNAVQTVLINVYSSIIMFKLNKKNL